MEIATKCRVFITCIIAITTAMLPHCCNSQSYVSPPFSLPPFDSLGPMPLPENASPSYCVNPPFTPQTPPLTTTSPPSPFDSLSPPVFPDQIPPSPLESSSPPEITPGPPFSNPSPPDFSFPSPPETTPGPPDFSFPTPPEITPGPPRFDFPGPPSGLTPSPTVFIQPAVLSPPIGPPSETPKAAMWCVAKPSIPGPIIQEALNYACGSGADCDSILPQGKCYEPNSLYAHASYAFNSYWQKTKAAGGTCDFGGTAVLVTVDPSSSGCRFETY